MHEARLGDERFFDDKVVGSVDVVLARNSLDHVDNPRQVVSEAKRILRPGGTLILLFDVGHTPTATEPHTLSLDGVRSWLRAFEVTRAELSGEAFGDGSGQRAIIIARRTSD